MQRLKSKQYIPTSRTLLYCLSGYENLAKYYWEHNTAAARRCVAGIQKTGFLLQTTMSRAGSIMSGPVLIKHTTKRVYIYLCMYIIVRQAR